MEPRRGKHPRKEREGDVAMTSQQTRAINLQWADIQMKTFGQCCGEGLMAADVCVLLWMCVFSIYTLQNEWKLNALLFFLLFSLCVCIMSNLFNNTTFSLIRDSHEYTVYIYIYMYMYIEVKIQWKEKH